MKFAKKSLSILLALIMAMSVFSVALTTASATDQNLLPANAKGTVTLDLDIYLYDSVNDSWSLIPDNSSIAPGAVIKVVVGSQTDFYAGNSAIQVFYDKNNYNIWNYETKSVYDDVNITALNTAGLIQWCTPENGFNTTIERDVSNGYLASELYYDCITVAESGARVNHFPTTSAEMAFWPYDWRSGTSVAAAYTNYRYVWVNMAVSGGGNNDQNDGLGARLMMIQEQDIFAFCLKAKDTITTSTAAPVFIPGVAIAKTARYANGRVKYSKYDPAEPYTSTQLTVTTSGFSYTLQQGTIGDATWLDDYCAVSNITIAPQSVSESYDVSFFTKDNIAISSYAQTDLEAGTSITLPAGPVVTGKTFAGWSNGTNTYAAGASYEVNADTSFVATYTDNYYTVSFYEANGDLINAQQVIYGGSATAPTPATVTGKTFAGWDKTFNNVTDNLSVTATYNDIYYTVTFYEMDGTTPIGSAQSVIYGGAATAPTAPTVTGKNFVGWSVSFDAVYSDLSVVAQYSGNQYTVTFVDWNGNNLGTSTVNYGGAATAPVNPTRTGYDFAGWDKSFNNVIASMTVTATYTPKSFTVSFDGASADYDYGTVITFVAATAPENMVFTSWTDGTNTYLAGETYTVTGNVAFTSNFSSTIAAYTVNVYKQNIDGATYALSQYTKNGTIGSTVSVGIAEYLDTGFVYSTGTLSGTVLANGSLELSIYYDRESYTYTFNAFNGSEWSTFGTSPVLYGATAANPAGTPATYTIGDYDYNFNGWYLDQTAQTAYVPAAATGALTLYAGYTAVPNKLIYTNLNAAAAEFAATVLPHNLYFYTDAAILSVASAFGWADMTVEQYIAYIAANGYTCNLLGNYAYADADATVTPADQTDIDDMETAIEAALEAIQTVENPGLGTSTNMPARAESKAQVGFTTLADTSSAAPGDVVTFSVYAKTNFYLGGLLVPVIYDSTAFVPYINGAAATASDLANAVYDDDLTAITTNDDLFADGSYAFENLYFDSLDSYYPAGTTADYMNQYKLIYIYISADSAAEIFSDANNENGVFLFSYQLKVLDAAAEGDYTVGTDASWQAVSVATQNNPLAITRAASATDTAPADIFAQFGQTLTVNNATVAVADIEYFTVKIHTWDEDNWDTTVIENTYASGTIIEMPTNVQVADECATHAPWVDIINGGLYAAGASYTVNGNAEFYLLGDVSGDGSIDSYDSSLINRFVNEIITVDSVLDTSITFIWQVANVKGYDADFELTVDSDWYDYYDSLDASYIKRYVNSYDVTLG